MKKNSRLGGLFWLVLGISICIESVKLNLGDLHRPGPGFMPFLAGTLLGALGLILGFSKISNGLEEKVSSKKIWVKGGDRNIIFPLLALIGYVLLLDLVGFLVTTFIFLLLLFKLAEPKRWFIPLALAGGTVVLSHLIFSVWLQCPFPKGAFKF